MLLRMLKRTVSASGFPVALPWPAIPAVALASCLTFATVAHAAPEVGSIRERLPGGVIVEAHRIATEHPTLSRVGLAHDDGVSLYMAQPLRGATLHLSSRSVAGHESHAFSLDSGPATVTLVNGHGAGLPFSRHAFGQADANLFHGYASREFTYTGGAVDFALPAIGRLQAGGVSVSSAQVSDRHAYFVGVERGGVAAGAFAVDRGGERAGRGLEVMARVGRLDFGLRELRDVHGTRWRQAAVTWHRSPDSSFGLALGQSESRLYRDADDVRAMFTFSTALGPARPSALPAGEDGEAGDGEAPSPTWTHRRLALLAGGAAAAAVLISSGDDGGDGVARYGSQDEAAFNALAGINPTSVRENVEYGGSVYGNPDGTFSHSRHVKGDIASVAFNPHDLVPAGGRALAAYHTHGGPDPRFVNEFFSPQDLAFFRSFGVDGYLGTPAGRMWLFDLSAGTVNQFVTADGNEFILPH